jgi:Tfp pilus assembly protein PilV
MKNEKGFSFPEVLVSLTIVVGGLLMVAHSTAATVNANYRVKQEGIVSTYVQQKVERLKTASYTDADLTAGTHSDAPASGFSRSWTVTSNAADRQKTIVLSVSRAVSTRSTPVTMNVVITRVR